MITSATVGCSRGLDGPSNAVASPTTGPRQMSCVNDHQAGRECRGGELTRIAPGSKTAEHPPIVRERRRRVPRAAERATAPRVGGRTRRESPPAIAEAPKKSDAAPHRSPRVSWPLEMRHWRSQHPDQPRAKRELDSVRLTVYGVDRNGSLAGYKTASAPLRSLP